MTRAIDDLWMEIKKLTVEEFFELLERFSEFLMEQKTTLERYAGK